MTVPGHPYHHLRPSVCKYTYFPSTLYRIALKIHIFLFFLAIIARNWRKMCNFAPANNNKCDSMPEISKFYGIIIYMYIDDHNPPHFHVWYDDYEVEITIKDGIVTGSLPRRALRLVFEWLDLHRDELMENWERLTNSEAAKKIEPLR